MSAEIHKSNYSTVNMLPCKASQFGPGEGLLDIIKKKFFATAQTSTGLVCKALYFGLSIYQAVK